VDVGAQAELHRLMRAVADSSGSAVVLCSSDERELSGVCDRVIVLCDGTVTAELTGDQLVSKRIAQQSLRPPGGDSATTCSGVPAGTASGSAAPGTRPSTGVACVPGWRRWLR
jgi:ABC-type multidrug transport system ATPase subunit